MNKQKELLEILAPHRVSGNTVSRAELSVRLGIPDRTVREIIAEARKSGVPIISDSRTNGYYLSYEQDDVLKITLELRSRAFDLLETARALEVHLKDKDPNQIVLWEDLKWGCNHAETQG